MVESPHGEMTEADVTINGKSLSFGQVMTLRVAIGSFLIGLQESDALGDDENGRAMTKAYKARLAEIMNMLTEGAK